MTSETSPLLQATSPSSPSNPGHASYNSTQGSDNVDVEAQVRQEASHTSARIRRLFAFTFPRLPSRHFSKRFNKQPSSEASQSTGESAEKQPLRFTKGRCWCCWEEEETPENPLIRVCLTCKDPDLKWIHQICVDEYITNLPPPRQLPQPQQPNPPLQPPNQDDIPPPPPLRLIPVNLTEPTSTPSSSSSSAIENENRSQAIAQGGHTQIVVAPNNVTPPSAGTTTGNATPPAIINEETPLLPGQSQRKFACTRCGDPYLVFETPVPRIYVLWEDPFLKFAVILMTVCMIILTACCVLLLVEHWGTNSLVFDFGWFKVRTTTFATSMFLLCHSLNGVTMYMVWDHCGGRTRKHVVGISDEKIAEAEGLLPGEDSTKREEEEHEGASHEQIGDGAASGSSNIEGSSSGPSGEDEAEVVVGVGVVVKT